MRDLPVAWASPWCLGRPRLSPGRVQTPGNKNKDLVTALMACQRCPQNNVLIVCILNRQHCHMTPTQQGIQQLLAAWGKVCGLNTFFFKYTGFDRNRYSNKHGKSFQDHYSWTFNGNSHAIVTFDTGQIKKNFRFESKGVTSYPNYRLKIPNGSSARRLLMTKSSLWECILWCLGKVEACIAIRAWHYRLSTCPGGK